MRLSTVVVDICSTIGRDALTIRILQVVAVLTVVFAIRQFESRNLFQAHIVHPDVTDLEHLASRVLGGQRDCAIFAQLSSLEDMC